MSSHHAHQSTEKSMKTTGDSHGGHQGHYRSLMIELAIDFVIMYLVMYTMIRTLNHFYLNVNNVWMTLMMVTPMGLVMLVAMRSMFPSRNRNLLLIAGALVVFGVSYYGMRAQVGVGDKQFLRSMIPHHSGAILMCQEASLRDPELKALCGQIVDSQQKEIAQMQAMLEKM
jgi:hypothetical protein